MTDIPASCYAQHLSPPRHVEYELEGKVAVVLEPRAQSVTSLTVTVHVPYHVTYMRTEPYDNLMSHNEIIADARDLIEACVKDVLPSRDPEDIIETITITELRETR